MFGWTYISCIDSSLDQYMLYKERRTACKSFWWSQENVSLDNLLYNAADVTHIHQRRRYIYMENSYMIRTIYYIIHNQML